MKELHSTIQKANGFRFFSSSLLIAYDANPHSNNDEDEISVRMIDFAHSTFNGFLNDEKYDGIDDGYLLGCDSLIRVLSSIHDGSLKPAPLTDLLLNTVNSIPQNSLNRSSIKRKLSNCEKRTENTLTDSIDIHEKKISGFQNKKCVEVETKEEKMSLYIENSSSESSSDDILITNQKFVGLLPLFNSSLGPGKNAEENIHS